MKIVKYFRNIYQFCLVKLETKKQLTECCCDGLSCRYERMEIPIHIVPHTTIGKVCLESAVELPKILCQEEQDAYRRIHRYSQLCP